MTARPDAFDAYWDGIDRELERYPARPVLEPMPRHSTDFATLYWVRLTSVGPYRIGGYYSVPHGSGPFPALLNTPGYGSVNHIPDYNDQQRYAVLTIMHRGQRLADQPFAAAYPGLLTHGIDRPDSYVYRGVLADCIRGAEFLLVRPEVDRERVAIAGDDLALITAARRPGFSSAVVAGLLFYRLMEVRERTEAYPVEEINDYLRAYPDRRDAVTQTLAYFDPVHHVPRVSATTLLSVGSPGAVGGPEWLEPPIQAHAGPLEQYLLTNEGGTDHDRIDAWLAGRMGVEPMSRFLRMVGQ
jgi:cephalosporin-C deacetylase